MIIILCFILFILLALYLWIQLYRDKEEYTSYTYPPIDTHIAIGGAIYNCEQHIDPLFKNIQRIGRLFEQCSVVIAIDRGTDQSLEKLKEWQKKWTNTKFQLFILEGEQTGSRRTERLANARNRILTKLRELYTVLKFNHFIIMDCDDVCSQPIRLEGLKNVFKKQQDWDAVSFIGNGSIGHNLSENYYDYWALSIQPFVLSCWHFKEPHKIIEQMKQFLTQKINQSNGQWIPCYSAFNGLAIYKQRFLKYHYHWNVKDIVQFIPRDLYAMNIQQAESEFDINRQEDDCEHRYFHFSAVFKDKARIFVVPEQLF